MEKEKIGATATSANYKKELLDMSWQPTTHNVTGRENLWFRSCVFSHNCFCGCNDVVTHFNRLAQRLTGSASSVPPDSTPRPAMRALPAPPVPPPSPRRHTTTENQPCGGDGVGDGGPRGGGAGAGDDADLATEDVDELLELLDDPE